MNSIATKPYSLSSCSCCQKKRLFSPVKVNNPLQMQWTVPCIGFSLNPNNNNNNNNNASVAVACKYPVEAEPHSGLSYFKFINPFRLVSPLLQSIKGRWDGLVQDQDQDPDPSSLLLLSDYMGRDRVRVMHGGGLGMALVTVKSTARDRFSPFMATLASNRTFVSGLLAWLMAQSMKVILNFILERKWDLRLLCASGGMPSSHSALCTALTTSVALCHGVADSLFPVCLGFSLIVMYDAIGVRRHAGMQAQVLNKIIEDLFQGHPISERKLKELLGHTPSQVVAGALLGIVVACFCCQGGLLPT